MIEIESCKRIKVEGTLCDFGIYTQVTEYTWNVYKIQGCFYEARRYRPSFWPTDEIKGTESSTVVIYAVSNYYI